METAPERSLPEIRWVPLDGAWEEEGENGLVFIGGEYDPQPSQQPVANQTVSRLDSEKQKQPLQKFINFGTLLFDQQFRDGRIKAQIEFDDVDYRSYAAIVFQYDT